MRAATVAEIRTTARALLVEHGDVGVSVRAVARAMGMTPAALYRYVDGFDELMVLVAVDVHDDLVAALERTRDEDPDAGVATRFLAVSRTFRRWALEHPVEFARVLANPVRVGSAPPGSPLQQAGLRLGRVFAGLFTELSTSGLLPVPAADDVDPGLLSAVTDDPGVARGMPATLLVLFAQAWTRLYGCVALEVSGQLAWAMDDTEPMFESVLRETAATMGLSHAYAPPS